MAKERMLPMMSVSLSQKRIKCLVRMIHDVNSIFDFFPNAFDHMHPVFSQPMP